MRQAACHTLPRSLWPLPAVAIRAFHLLVLPILLATLCCTRLCRPGLVCNAGCTIHLARGALPPARFSAVKRRAPCICRGLVGTLCPGVRAPVHVPIVFMRSRRRRTGLRRARGQECRATERTAKMTCVCARADQRAIQGRKRRVLPRARAARECVSVLRDDNLQ